MTTDSEKCGGLGFATAITASTSIMSAMKKLLPASARYLLGEIESEFARYHHYGNDAD
jgi:hypothetical protein